MKKFKNVLKKIKGLCDGLIGDAYALHRFVGANIAFAVTLFIGVSCSCNLLLTYSRNMLLMILLTRRTSCTHALVVQFL